MTRKNSFEVNGDTISISREDWYQIAFATYRDDYFQELTSHIWSIKNGYPNNASLGGGLHRYMMQKWYGIHVLKDLTDKGYVVDHMNNNHMDCRISNLEFLKHSRNVAKGQYLDKEAKQMKHRIAIGIFKDFYTGCYQITIGCNDTIMSEDAEGKQHLINSIKLLYDCDYALVVLDAEAILTEYEATNRFSLTHLHCCDRRIEEAPQITLTEEEKKQAIVVCDGQYYLIVGNGQAFIESVSYDEGWLPPGN